MLTRFVVWHLDAINVDEASYMVGASALLRGELPYSAFGDNKPPLIYVYYAVAQLVAGRGIDSVRLVTTLFTLPLTAYGVSAFYRHQKQGVVAALLFLLYSAAYTGSDMLAVNCEIVMMLPLAWSLVALRDAEGASRVERGLVAGLLMATAALVKYQAILWIPAAALAVAYANWPHRGRLLRVGGAFGLGLALPPLAIMSLFALAGGLDDFLYWNVTHNLEYLDNPLPLLQAVAVGLSRSGPFLIVTSMLWFGAVRSIVMGVSRYWMLVVVATLSMSVAAACLGLRFFPHYFIQLYVPLSIAAAPWAASVLTRPLRAPGLILSAFTLVAVLGWTQENYSRLRSEVVPAVNAKAASVASRLAADSCYESGSLFVWGSAPQFYYQAKLAPASRFFFPEFPLVRYYAGNPVATASRARTRRPVRRVGLWLQLMADLRRNRPAFVLDLTSSGIGLWQYFPLSDYPMLHQYVARHYRPVASVDGVVIYRRNDCPSERAPGR